MKTATIVNQQAMTYVQDFDKGLHELETWIKYMNYKLFLEHTHSYEYHRQRQLYLKKQENVYHEKAF